MDDSVKAFGLRVQQMRLRRQFSVQELAAQTGLTYQSIWRIERGRHAAPGLFTAMKIACALDCSLDWLAGRYAAGAML